MRKFAIGAAAALLAVEYALCCYLTDTDYPGNDIDRLEGRVYSARECQRLCQGVSTCELWTYQPSTDTCYLKRGGGAPTMVSGLISGPRVCPGPVDCSREGIDLYGGDLLDTTVANPLACQYQCSAIAGCAFWTFIRATNRCYLKGTNVEPRSLANAVSGPRTCPSTSPVPCEESTDFRGHDIRSFSGTVSDVERCQQLCRGFNNCFYWTFVASTSSCYLKNAQAPEGREVNPLTFSGARDCDLTLVPNRPNTTTTTTTPPCDCLLYNVDFAGADVSAFGLGSVIKPEACQLLCQYTNECFYFTFFEGTCYLKGADATRFMIQKNGAVSGPKDCTVNATPSTTTTTARTTTRGDDDTSSTAIAEGILKFLKAHKST